MARCDTYVPGQCTWGACQAAGWIPEGLGNGGDWAADAAARGYVVTPVPTLGAAVSYCAGDGYSEFGHCGIVTAVYPDGQFLVHEMNYVAPFVYDDRQSTTYDVCGFIVPPGVEPGQQGTLGMGAGPGGGLSIPGEISDMWEQIRAWSSVWGPQVDGWMSGQVVWADSIPG